MGCSASSSFPLLYSAFFGRSSPRFASANEYLRAQAGSRTGPRVLTGRHRGDRLCEHLEINGDLVGALQLVDRRRRGGVRSLALVSVSTAPRAHLRGRQRGIFNQRHVLAMVLTRGGVHPGSQRT